MIQEYVPGPVIGAVFMAAAGRSRLLGVTRQLVGAGWCGAAGFQYSGSVGPITLSPQETSDLDRAGQVLAASFKVEGLFGIDAILHEGRVWPVEVNPRYCASVEVLERAHGKSYMQDHIDACQGGSLPSQPNIDAGAVHGKAIVYASGVLRVPQLIIRESTTPPLADVPQPETQIAPGQPVVTVFGEGRTEQEVEEMLRRRVQRVRQLLSSDLLTLDMTSLD
jgi:predicted ATP-grasp superfamily ATP-dependent carboligase